MKTKLSTQKKIEVRFGEVDSMRIVWHGNYVKYFEDGREDFGKKYNLGYLQAEELGYLLPLVEINVQYKKPLKYGENAIVETNFVETNAAKLIFDYTIYEEKSRTVVCKGRTVQVFLNHQHQLQISLPPIFEEWKQKWFYAQP
jgi:acyl-CoA thioester hydrolase